MKSETRSVPAQISTQDQDQDCAAKYSLLIRLSFDPYAKSAWYARMTERGSKGTSVPGLRVLRKLQQKQDFMKMEYVTYNNTYTVEPRNTSILTYVNTL